MIITFNPNLLIYTPPKTSSESLHRAVRKGRTESIFGFGPSPWNHEIWDKHSIRPHAKTYIETRKPFKTILILRDEVERFYSFFRHEIYYKGYNNSIDVFLDEFIYHKGLMSIDLYTKIVNKEKLTDEQIRCAWFMDCFWYNPHADLNVDYISIFDILSYMGLDLTFYPSISNNNFRKQFDIETLSEDKLLELEQLNEKTKNVFRDFTNFNNRE